MTSRTHHTGVVRKRLVPLTLDNRYVCIKSTYFTVYHTKVRGLVPRHLQFIELSSFLFRPSSSMSWGTRVTLSSGKTVGKILGCYDNHAIGILRLPDL